VVINPLYQFAVIRRCAKNIGWTAACHLRLCDFRDRVRVGGPPSLTLKLKNAAHPIQMRTGKSSDRDVLEQVFIHKEYDPIALSSPRVILDLGANVGYTSMYLLSKFTTATVIAVEPDPGNFEICCRNLKRFGNRAKVIHGAAWTERTKLVLHRGGREWATQVRSAGKAAEGPADIEGYDLRTLIDSTGADEIDLLKVDIEGSERELFRQNADSWMPRVRNICIELHGQDCEAAFFQALSGYTYDLSRSGELTVCCNLRSRH